MRIASVFSGCGGVEIGAKRAGLTPIWGVECESHIARVYALNNPTANIIQRDIHDVDPSSLEPPDLLWASPPCQQYSGSRTTAKNDHPEKDAGLEVCKFIEKLKPRGFALENVPAYRNSDSMRKIAKTLVTAGYDIRCGVFCASHFGVPQERKRFLLWACRDGMAGDVRRYMIGGASYTHFGGKIVPIGEVLADEDLDKIGDHAQWNAPAYLNQQAFDRAIEGFRGEVVIDSAYRKYDEKVLSVRSALRPIFTILKAHARRGIFFCDLDKLKKRGWKELYRFKVGAFMKAQGFPDRFTWGEVPLTDRIAMIGDSVPPDMAQAVVQAATG